MQNEIWIDVDSFYASPQITNKDGVLLPLPYPLVQGFYGTLSVCFVGSKGSLPRADETLIVAFRVLGTKDEVFRTKAGTREEIESGVRYVFDLTADSIQLSGALKEREEILLQGGILAYTMLDDGAFRTRREWQMEFSVASTALTGTNIDPVPSTLEKHDKNPLSHAPIREAFDKKIADADARLTKEDARISRAIDAEIERAKGEEQSLSEKDVQLSKALSGEIDRATKEEVRISEALAGEVARAKQKEEDISQALSGEIERAKGEESRLDGKFAGHAEKNGDKNEPFSARAYYFESQNGATESGTLGFKNNKVVLETPTGDFVFNKDDEQTGNGVIIREELQRDYLPLKGGTLKGRVVFGGGFGVETSFGNSISATISADKTVELQVVGSGARVLLVGGAELYREWGDYGDLASYPDGAVPASLAVKNEIGGVVGKIVSFDSENHTWTGENAFSKNISALTAPSAGAHLTNKNYVDAKVAKATSWQGGLDVSGSTTTLPILKDVFVGFQWRISAGEIVVGETKYGVGDLIVADVEMIGIDPKPVSSFSFFNGQDEDVVLLNDEQALTNKDLSDNTNTYRLARVDAIGGVKTSLGATILNSDIGNFGAIGITDAGAMMVAPANKRGTGTVGVVRIAGIESTDTIGVPTAKTVKEYVSGGFVANRGETQISESFSLASEGISLFLIDTVQRAIGFYEYDFNVYKPASFKSQTTFSILPQVVGKGNIALLSDVTAEKERATFAEKTLDEKFASYALKNGSLAEDFNARSLFAPMKVLVSSPLGSVGINTAANGVFVMTMMPGSFSPVINSNSELYSFDAKDVLADYSVIRRGELKTYLPLSGGRLTGSVVFGGNSAFIKLLDGAEIYRDWGDYGDLSAYKDGVLVAAKAVKNEVSRLDEKIDTSANTTYTIREIDGNSDAPENAIPLLPLLDQAYTDLTEWEKLSGKTVPLGLLSETLRAAIEHSRNPVVKRWNQSANPYNVGAHDVPYLVDFGVVEAMGRNEYTTVFPSFSKDLSLGWCYLPNCEDIEKSFYGNKSPDPNFIFPKNKSMYASFSDIANLRGFWSTNASPTSIGYGYSGNWGAFSNCRKIEEIKFAGALTGGMYSTLATCLALKKFEADLSSIEFATNNPYCTSLRDWTAPLPAISSGSGFMVSGVLSSESIAFVLNSIPRWDDGKAHVITFTGCPGAKSTATTETFTVADETGVEYALENCPLFTNDDEDFSLRKAFVLAVKKKNWTVEI